jgi:predicted ATPase
MAATTANRRERQAAGDEFARQVQDALAHLYDPVYLQTHPLATPAAEHRADGLPAVPVPPRSRREAGESGSAGHASAALRRQLLDALACLQPAADTADPNRAWRAHRLLELRYVEALDPSQVQAQLGLGKSQYYVEHARAVAALVSVLRERWPERSQPDGRNTAPATNLPAALSSFVGREQELQAIRDLLLQPRVRLLTLTGTGGSGKTRLALEVAGYVLDRFADGACLVELASLADPQLVLPRIAEVLGIEGPSGAALVDGLADHLRGKRLLLVLDNFEHLLEAAPSLSGLLAACPHLKALVTSRAVLHLSGEHDFTVPPLAFPETAAVPALEQLLEYEAVRLFVERAQAAQADFGLTSQNAPAVAEICRRLDGLPLAIELAAARIRHLPPLALSARLERRLPLLADGPLDLPARQRTLRATITWSYELLAPGEQLLFRRLGVFAGGCTLDAAAVCAGTGGLPLDILDGLGALLDKSLLRREDSPGGEPRFQMLETVREYALEQLEASGEAELLRRRHALYFLAFAEQADQGLRTAAQTEWLVRLQAEQDNLRAALTWGRAQATTRAGATDGEYWLRLAGALSWFWHMRGHVGEGRAWLEAALAMGGEAPAAVRANALIGAAIMAERQGDYAQAVVALEEGLALHRQVGNQRGAALALGYLGIVARYQGDYDRSETLLEESAGLYEASGDHWGAAWAMANLARVPEFRGDWARATALLQQGLAVFRQEGDSWGTARMLVFLGNVACAQGQHDRAQALFEESLALPRDPRDVGDRWSIANALHGLADVAHAQGSYQQAAAHYAGSVALRHEIGDRRGFAHCLERLASLAATCGQAHKAARFLGAAATLRQAIGAPVAGSERASRERHVAQVRTALDPPAFQEAWDAGAAMSPAETVASAQAMASAIEAPPAATRGAPSAAVAR